MFNHLAFMCSSSDTSRYGMGSETPMHPSRTPLHPYMTPMRDPGGLFDFIVIDFFIYFWRINTSDV